MGETSILQLEANSITNMISSKPSWEQLMAHIDKNTIRHLEGNIYAAIRALTLGLVLLVVNLLALPIDLKGTGWH